ncbi:hypothetical protein ABPG77_007481 [Micractinium sp. CCAP 211/92]
MAAGSVSSYSIWVMPRGSLADKLHAEIKGLAGRTPGAPVFQPHVTLLGGIQATEADVLHRAQQLAARLKPYRITLDQVSCGSIFHQCVYVLCSTGAETMQAGAATREAYGQDPTGRYMPHLSLLYADISTKERERVAAEEQRRLFGGEQPLLAGEELGFDVTSLTVWETEESDKSLNSWRMLAEYELAG